MPFQPGKSGNPAGKPKGAKSQRTEQWEALAKDIVGKHADRFNKNLQALGPVEFNELYIKILKWFKPQLANTAIDITSDGDKLELLTNEELISRLNKILDTISD